MPGTNLASSVVNFDAFVGITGQNTDRFASQIQRMLEGSLEPQELDPDDVRNWSLSPEQLAAQIVAVIDMPWGVDVSDITVRATGEDYVL